MSSYKTNWDVAEIASQIRSISNTCSNAGTDGFTAFELKKDLYLLQLLLKEALDSSPDFGETEQRWLTEQEKKRIIKILKS
jgi:hypothetical protein